MKVLERYVYLEEKDSSLISGLWKGFQVLFYVMIFLSGMMASLSLGEAMSSFGGNCYLFGNVTFSGTTSIVSGKIPVDNLKTEWGKEYVCNYCLYIPICGVIFSVVWTTFFLMCGKGGRTKVGIHQPWRVAFPALIFNAIFFLTSLPASVNVEMGTIFFCDKFIQNNNETHCSELVKYLLFEKKLGESAYKYFYVAEISSWIHTLCWLSGTILLLLRCFTFADFQLIQVTVTNYNPSRHKILKEIAEYPESED